MNAKQRVIQVTTLLFAIGLTGMAFGYLIARERDQPNSHGHSHAHAAAAGHAHEDGHSHEAEHSHAGHSHGASDADTVELTAAAMENLKIDVARVRKSEFVRELSLPGEITPLPGYGKRIVAATVSGVVQQISVVQGQAVPASKSLCQLKIIDKDFSTTQMTLLKNENRMTVIDREIERLSSLAQNGIAQRRTRDLTYEREQLVAEHATLSQALRFHGLDDWHFEQFLNQGKLIESIGLKAADQDEDKDRPRPDDSEKTPEFYVVDTINVSVGQTVNRGDPVCTLSNQSELQVRGMAFESDFSVVNRLYTDRSNVRVNFGHDPGSHLSDGEDRNLPITFVESAVDSTRQSLHFYMQLKNEIIGKRQDEQGRQFNSWRFRPGQRVHLRLPVESWSDQWKLPAGAVVSTGSESLVFRQVLAVGDRKPTNGLSPFQWPISDHAEFEAVPVRVKFRDDRYAVIEDDGSLGIGDRIVMSNAYQVQLAQDRSAGGAVDAHHGHSH